MTDEKKICSEKIKYFVWILSGILLAWAFTAMILSPKGSIFCFFHEGEVEDYDVLPINSLADTVGMEMEEGVLKIGEPEACKGLFLRNDSLKALPYLYIQLSKLNGESLNGTLLGFDSQGIQVMEKSIVLVNGSNEILLTHEKLSRIEFRFTGEAGKKFYVNRMELRELNKEFSIYKYVLLFFLLFGLYFVFSYLVNKKISGHLSFSHSVRETMNLIQTVYFGLYERFGRIGRLFCEKAKSRLRMLCFFCVFLVNIYVTKFSNYHNSMVYRFEILLTCLCLFAAAFLYLSDNMKKIDYRNPLVTSWCVLCLMMIISDFIVPKRTMYTGYWLLLCWGFFFWVWNHMENPQIVLRELCRAFYGFFWLSVMFCLFCTERVPEFYKGMTNNPNTLGQFMSVSIVVILSCLLAENISYPRVVFISAAIDFAIYYTIMSQCRSAILADMCVFVIFFFSVMHLKKRKEGGGELRKKVMVCICATLLLYIPIAVGSEKIMEHNSVISSHFREPEQEMESIISNQNNVVYAAQLSAGKIFERFQNSMNINQFSSGRLYIYLQYLKNMNLLGHNGNLDIYGIGTGAHNSILMIGYNYGIFAVIPYIIMIIYGFVYSVQYMISTYKRPEKYGFFLCAMVVCTIICGMLDHIEQAMRYMPWFMIYFVIGYFFGWDEADAD
ncbi:MAG: hypothetical protein K2P76_02730 [Lachnospiraceae bacterium]|nr:hypothetical protein [Lachnospiraceae bacterium]